MFYFTLSLELLLYSTLCLTHFRKNVKIQHYDLFSHTTHQTSPLENFMIFSTQIYLVSWKFYYFPPFHLQTVFPFFLYFSYIIEQPIITTKLSKQFGESIERSWKRCIWNSLLENQLETELKKLYRILLEISFDKKTHAYKL